MWLIADGKKKESVRGSPRDGHDLRVLRRRL